MDFAMEDLMPLVGKLAAKYTAGDSTSLPYEKAEQLMGAVLYCIREALQESAGAPAARHTDAAGLYTAGLRLVEEKARRALQLYHSILPEFDAYGNRCLENDINEMPMFFRRYDMMFCPQDTILTLDYPLLADLSDHTGIDRIYAYLSCIRLEQRCLGSLPRESVLAALRRHCENHQDMAENLYGIVMEKSTYPNIFPQ